MKDETQRRYEKDMQKNNKLIDIFNATGAQLRKDENAHWVIYKVMASGVVIEGRHLSSVSQAILNYGKAFIEYVTDPQKPIVESDEIAELKRKLAYTEDLLKVTDSILNERKRLLDAIPECPLHGGCVPHALEWIEKAKAVMSEQQPEPKKPDKMDALIGFLTAKIKEVEGMAGMYGVGSAKYAKELDFCRGIEFVRDHIKELSEQPTP